MVSAGPSVWSTMIGVVCVFVAGLVIATEIGMEEPVAALVEAVMVKTPEVWLASATVTDDGVNVRSVPVGVSVIA